MSMAIKKFINKKMNEDKSDNIQCLIRRKLMKKYDVLALGELLVDFTCSGENENGNLMFEANPGGAPCNVLALLAKHGRSTAFIGKVGDDMFGHMLSSRVEAAGIDISGLSFTKEVPTTLAFVKISEDGDRDFSFYRNPGADMMLTKADLKKELIENSKIFHFGTISMTHDKVREATKEAVNTAKNAGCIISFDPNLREPLWDSLENAREQILYGLSVCNILKIADNEMDFIAGTTDFDKGAGILRSKYPQIKIFNITAGAKGSYCYYENKKVFVPALKLGATIDTTGAGDTFCGSVLNYVLEHGMEGYSEDNIREMLTYANAAAYLVTTKKGAICSMPDIQEVEKIINSHPDCK